MGRDSEDRPLAAKHQHLVDRRALTVSGVIQGVGFRPFVHRLAHDLGLSGWVRNQIGAVVIEVEGAAEALARFETRLIADAPPGARVDRIDSIARRPTGAADFVIEASVPCAEAPVRVPADLAICAACLAELFDATNRRHRYPFTSCTACGPRFSILRDLPYDRARTTLAEYPLCARCDAEYRAPADRRFHAETTGCAQCGPALVWTPPVGEDHPSTLDPVRGFAAGLRAGRIGALKSTGGYHLVADATSEAAVQRLRERKFRPEKPFAVMVRDLQAARALGAMTPEAEALLTGPARPILLIERDPARPGLGLAPSVTRGSHRVGVMLPATPVQHLLAAELEFPLIMTSGNLSDVPLIHRDDEAREVLGAVADTFLSHGLEIHQRLDDSVFLASPLVPLRRARGFAPLPVPLGAAPRVPTLAVGGQMKATFALAADGEAILGHHVGDLHEWGAVAELEQAAARYETLHGITPRRIVHDLHPDYASTRYALARARGEGLEAVAIQHHHAHMAAGMAEHGLVGPALGVVFDGTGLGLDGALWGGEFLLGTQAAVERFAHLAYVPMPGGAQAVREPWRMAVAHVLHAGLPVRAAGLGARIDEPALHFVARLAERRMHAPLTSSVGRLFDAVSSLLGLVDRAGFDGHAPMRLESLAATARASAQGSARYAFGLEAGERPLRLDPAPVIRALLDDLARGLEPAEIARAFHAALASAVVAVAERARSACGLEAVVLTGGVFANGLLAAECEVRLRARGFSVYAHRVVPPNDGGLSYGQLAAVTARDRLGAR